MFMLNAERCLSRRTPYSDRLLEMSPDEPFVPEFDQVLKEGAALQRQLPWLNLVLVGGAAAAIHAEHRYSVDTDHVSLGVAENFDKVKAELETWEGWKTNRVRRPFVILGERHDVELGIRQQRRSEPLDVERKEGMWVPTPAEALRIKAFLCTDRQATRDYLDVAALVDLIGEEQAEAALSTLNLLYKGEGNQSCVSRFAEVSQQEPVDLQAVDLSTYRGIQAPYNDWQYVKKRVAGIGARLLEREMEGELPAPPELDRERDEQRADDKGRKL